MNIPTQGPLPTDEYFVLFLVRNRGEPTYAIPAEENAPASDSSAPAPEVPAKVKHAATQTHKTLRIGFPHPQNSLSVKA